MTLSYEVGENLYINLTNQCPCRCEFCIRKNADGAYDSDPLWLEHEPNLDELKENLLKREISRYKELVFCSYGEPTMRMDILCSLAEWLKRNYPNCILRLNTNGLADLFNPSEVPAAERLSLFDKISISLNAGDAETYARVTRPQMPNPEEAYSAVLHFANDCKNRNISVSFTLVDIISPEEIELARQVAESLAIPLRIRKYIS